MNQKIIQIDARELFADFFAPDKSRNDKDGIEKYFEWPEEIGRGFMYTIKLRPGLVLGIGRYRLIENIAISFALNQSPVIRPIDEKSHAES